MQLASGLGTEYRALLTMPHRRVCHRFSAVVASRALTFLADGYVLTDVLLLCTAHRSDPALRPWLLGSLRETSWGDVALDDDRGRASALVRGRLACECMHLWERMRGRGQREGERAGEGAAGVATA